MFRLILATTCFYIYFLQSLAFAGWQGADWGMPEAAALHAFKLNAQPLRTNDPGGIALKEIGPAKYTFGYKLNSYDFTGYMLFANDHFAGIRLDSHDPGACSSAINLLTTSYGSPDMVMSGEAPIPNWLDRKDSNRYRIVDIEVINSCEIIIDSLPAGSGPL